MGDRVVAVREAREGATFAPNGSRRCLGERRTRATPTGLTATANGRTRADLAWTAATDGVGVTSYAIYRNGTLVMSVAGTVTAWSDYSLSPGTTYTYTVKALDAAGNASAASSPANVTTANGSGGSDVTAPSVPTGLAVTAVTSKQLDLAWTASTDNTGVQGYRVYRDGTLVATVGTARYSDTGLAAGSGHSYTVAALDGAGNASAQSGSASGTALAPVASTAYGYDLADRLTAITPAAGTAVTFTLDALGRHRTRTEGSATDTDTYAAESAAIVRIASSGGSTTSSAVDAGGSRIAVATGAGGFGWTLADLHGDVAGAVAQAGGTVTDATRYDPWGEVVSRTSSTLPGPWGYQGRLDLASGADTDLLDFGFRPYVPDLGFFTSPDDQAGGALDPMTFNRYLYAAADPETLVDPDGHNPLCLLFGAATVGTGPGTALAVGGCEIGTALFAGAVTAVGTWLGWNVVGPAIVGATTAHRVEDVASEARQKPKTTVLPFPGHPEAVGRAWDRVTNPDAQPPFVPPPSCGNICRRLFKVGAVAATLVFGWFASHGAEDPGSEPEVPNLRESAEKRGYVLDPKQRAAPHPTQPSARARPVISLPAAPAGRLRGALEY